MCGIVGVFKHRGMVEPEMLTAMRDVMAHRGPDDVGLWISKDQQLGMAHRRLSILDLSSAARQPMTDETGRVRIVFNGEIYNFQELRRTLNGMGHSFQTQSDTEVILKAYMQWGTDCLDRLNGMFAFGIYDAETCDLFLARDRTGKKPLYYVNRPEYLGFASELKALLADKEQNYRMDTESLLFYFTYGYVPGGSSILQGVNKLPAGHALIYNSETRQTRRWRYWFPPEPSQENGTDDAGELLEQLEALLFDAVRLRLVSDVPLGILLSGGLDSSLIVAAAARQSGRSVKTFTISFPGVQQYDEAPFARQIADHFSTEHYELSGDDGSFDMLAHLAWHFDEPLADSSLLPTFLVSKLTRQHVTVALGGDGGDELFGGYRHYARAQRLSRLACLPGSLMRLVADCVGRLPAGIHGRNFLSGLKGGPYQAHIYGTPYFDRVQRRNLFLPEVLAAGNWRESQPEDYMLDRWRSEIHGLQAMMLLDFQTSLADDILAKVDRASMATSLEVRAPWLDYRIVEFAFGKVSLGWKVKGSETRRLQRRLVQKLVPGMIDRKQGFSIPLAQWLTGRWRQQVEEVMLEGDAPFVDWNFAQKTWKQLCRGYSNGARVFAVLMYELWWRNYRAHISV